MPANASRVPESPLSPVVRRITPAIAFVPPRMTLDIDRSLRRTSRPFLLLLIQVIKPSIIKPLAFDPIEDIGADGRPAAHTDRCDIIGYRR
jgi:hypothetical protein